MMLFFPFFCGQEDEVEENKTDTTGRGVSKKIQTRLEQKNKQIFFFVFFGHWKMNHDGSLVFAKCFFYSDEMKTEQC